MFLFILFCVTIQWVDILVDLNSFTEVFHGSEYCRTESVAFKPSFLLRKAIFLCPDRAFSICRYSYCIEGVTILPDRHILPVQAKSIQVKVDASNLVSQEEQKKMLIDTFALILMPRVPKAVVGEFCAAKSRKQPRQRKVQQRATVSDAPIPSTSPRQQHAEQSLLESNSYQSTNATVEHSPEREREKLRMEVRLLQTELDSIRKEMLFVPPLLDKDERAELQEQVGKANAGRLECYVKSLELEKTIESLRSELVSANEKVRVFQLETATAKKLLEEVATDFARCRQEYGKYRALEKPKDQAALKAIEELEERIEKLEFEVEQKNQQVCKEVEACIDLRRQLHDARSATQEFQSHAAQARKQFELDLRHAGEEITRLREELAAKGMECETLKGVVLENNEKIRGAKRAVAEFGSLQLDHTLLSANLSSLRSKHSEVEKELLVVQAENEALKHKFSVVDKKRDMELEQIERETAARIFAVEEEYRQRKAKHVAALKEVEQRCKEQRFRRLDERIGRGSLKRTCEKCGGLEKGMG